MDYEIFARQMHSIKPDSINGTPRYKTSDFVR